MIVYVNVYVSCDGSCEETVLGSTIPLPDVPRKAAPVTEAPADTPTLSVRPSHSLEFPHKTEKSPRGQASAGLTAHSFVQLQSRRKAKQAATPSGKTGDQSATPSLPHRKTDILNLQPDVLITPDVTPS